MYLLITYSRETQQHFREKAEPSRETHLHLPTLALSLPLTPQVSVNWKQNVTIGYPLGDLMPPWVEHHWDQGELSSMHQDLFPDPRCL